jgi:hypothetical protein
MAGRPRAAPRRKGETIRIRFHVQFAYGHHLAFPLARSITTMKKLLLASAALALCASSAFAVGVDLNFDACPGNTGATQDATIDCAAGGMLTAHLTFAPAEAIADLVALDTLLDLYITGGDINAASGNFWDFQNTNQNGLGLLHTRPSAGCTGYTNTWNQTGAGVSLGALVRSPSNVRVAAGSYRPGAISTIANQKLYGYQLTIDAATSTQGGGTQGGCQLAAAVVIDHAIPQSSIGTPTTMLTGPNLNASLCGHLNGDVTSCGAVPTVRHTWNQLKSLYR